MKKIIIVLTLFVAQALQAQVNLNALWLRHTCGYTNGINLLGGDVWGNAVCADTYGNSYNSGNFSGFWFAMDTVIDMGNNRFYINKYNNIGDRLWTAKAMGTTINSIMTSSRMKCDSLGNVYVCGTFSIDDSVYMAPNWYPVGSGYVAKYDSSGNNLWCAYVPRTGTTYISFTDMELVNGSIYVCGIMGFGIQSFGTFNFNTSYSQNGIIAKLDLNGNILHAELLDSNSTNEIHGIEVSKNSNEIYLVGQHISSNLTVDAQTLTHTAAAQNSFIVKMNSSFTALWAKKCNTYLHLNQTVGSSVSCLRRIEIDKLDNIYVTANGNGDSTVIGSLSFNHRISPNDSYAQDIYIAKLNSSGQEIWLQHGGSDGMDNVSDLATDEWGNSIISVYSSQQSVSGLIFNTDTIPQWHGGIVKYDPSGNLLYTQKLQEARSLQALALGNDSVFYGTGNGFNPGLPYINLSIPQCEDTVNGYYNPPYKMIMVKFLDNTSVHTAVIETNEDIIQDLIVYPNPFSSITTLELHLSKAGNTSISILDVVGRTVKNLSASNLQAGEHKITIDLSHLKSGIYFCQIKSSNKTKTIRLIKV
jgi:hypothetical protein